jgi:hypothetical protein
MKINGALIDPSKTYIFGSCYGHSSPLGQVCRTEGGSNPVFFELIDPDDYRSAVVIADPVNSEKILGFGPPKQVAPDRFIHPVHTLRRYLDSLPNNRITEAQFGIGRVQHVNTTTVNNDPSPLPVSSITGIVQPIDGLGPDFLKRNIQIIKSNDD